MSENKDKDLEIIIQESGLEKTQGQTILDNFTHFFKEASEWETKAKLIVITDVTQAKEMAQAREARLALKNIRVGAENTRKSLKEKALREGKAIDGIANVIKALIVPLEEYLEKQEKFAENIQKEKQEKQDADRLAELLKYTQDISMYNYKELSEEAFGKLLASLKKSFEDEQARIQKIEDDRKAKEIEDKKETERIRIENEKLKEDARLKEEAEKKEKDEQKKKDEEQAEKLRIAEKEKKDAEEKLRKEKERQQKEEDDRKAKEAQEKKDKELADLKIKQEQEEKERQAKLAPEKDKLFDWSEKIKAIEVPTDLSKAGLEIVKDVEQKLLAISQEIKIKIKNL